MTRKTGWPWRLGTSSYILPDDILPNVRFLGPLVDDIELVLFESGEHSNLPGPKAVEELASLARAHELSYTVHLPIDLHPGSPSARDRSRAVDTYRRVIDLTEPLNPFGYVLHLEADRQGRVPSDDVPRWLANLERTLEALLGAEGVRPEMLCAETLGYPYEMVWPLVQRYGLAVTLDIGHVWTMGYDAEAAARTLLPRSRIVHLHGVSGVGGQDHRGLEVADRDLLGSFLRALGEQSEGPERVVTLEVFSRQHLDTSLQVLDGYREAR